MLDIHSSLLCNGSESPLHKVIQNDRNRQWPFASYSFLNQLFVKFPSIYFDNCYDKDGYNLLHRSVIGGHPTAVKYLLEKGMNVLQISKSNQSALTLSILLAPYTRNGSIPSYYTNHSRFHSYKLVNQTEMADIIFDHNGIISFDDIASNLLMQHLQTLQFNRTKLKKNMCPYRVDDLGLIHIASAKGMLSFLKSSKEVFGDEILKCENKYGVTPIYLAYIYNHTHIVKWLEMKCTFHRPDSASELMIMYNLIENYELPLIYEWRCFTHFGQDFKALRRNQILKCIGNDFRLPIIFQNPIKSIAYKILHKEMSATFLENYWPSLKLENKYSFFFQYHSEKKSHDHVYYLYRLLLLFGSDDRRYLFQLLYSRRTSTKGTVFDPIPDLTVKTIFDSILSKKYDHLRKLKMGTNLHKGWLSDEIHTALTEDFQYDLYKNYEVKHFDNILEQWAKKGDAEMILTKKANINCNVCQQTISKSSINSLNQTLSNIKTYDDLNREAMKFIPECNYRSHPSMNMLFDYIITYLRFVAGLKAPDKNEFKAQVIELEFRIKRTVKMIDSFPEKENEKIQLFELFPYLPVFNGFFNCIDDLEMYSSVKCMKLYAKNEHLKVFKKLLITILQVVELEFEYDYHI